MTIFCKPDNKLVNIIKEEYGNRIVVDCGAGEGVLHNMMPKGTIISLDIIDHGNPEVTIMNCRDFLFNKNHLPIFIRPCHSGFVEETLLIAYSSVESALYIGLEKNRKEDLGIFYNLSFIVHNEWTGSEGEKVWRIPFTREKLI
jgi:hypothetical protein